MDPQCRIATGKQHYPSPAQALRKDDALTLRNGIWDAPLCAQICCSQMSKKMAKSKKLKDAQPTPSCGPPHVGSQTIHEGCSQGPGQPSSAKPRPRPAASRCLKATIVTYCCHIATKLTSQLLHPSSWRSIPELPARKIIEEQPAKSIRRAAVLLSCSRLSTEAST